MKPRRGLPQFFQREIEPLDWPNARQRKESECGSCPRPVRLGVVRCWPCRLRLKLRRIVTRWERS